MIDPNHVLRVGAATDLYVDQLQAKVAELEADLEFQTNARIQDRKDAETNYKNWNAELKKQLAAAQEEIAVLRKDAETYGPEKISLQKQAWLEADRQRQINDLKNQLAKAEQRVAEACAYLAHQHMDADIAADAINNGEWRKFVKEV